jgi:hypothetical protein
MYHETPRVPRASERVTRSPNTSTPTTPARPSGLARHRARRSAVCCALAMYLRRVHLRNVRSLVKVAWNCHPTPAGPAGTSSSATMARGRARSCARSRSRSSVRGRQLGSGSRGTSGSGPAPMKRQSSSWPRTPALPCPTRCVEPRRRSTNRRRTKSERDRGHGPGAPHAAQPVGPERRGEQRHEGWLVLCVVRAFPALDRRGQGVGEALHQSTPAGTAPVDVRRSDRAHRGAVVAPDPQVQATRG